MKHKYVLTRSFNQDPLENFFSYIRSHGVRNVSPGAKQFSSSFKTLIVNNFMAYHSPFSNCEKDECDFLLQNMKTFFSRASDNGTPDRTIPMAIPQIDIPHFDPLFKRNKI